VRHYVFAKEYTAILEENLGVLYVAWFSYEAHIHLNGYIASPSEELNILKIYTFSSVI
jgi:hypothetical protein